jgi:hypothetical protein
MNGWIIFIVILVILVILAGIALWLLLPRGIVKPSWQDKPRNRYPDVVNEFGLPDILDAAPHGLAIWRADSLKGTPWKSIVIKDEQIPHCCPAEHYDFLSSAVCVDIDDPLLLAIILSISKSIWYDQLKHLLWVRCHFMGANVATAVLATRVLLGNLRDPTKTLKKLSPLDTYWDDPNEIQTLYHNIVMESKNKNNYKKLNNELKKNLTKLSCTQAKKCVKVGCDTTLNSTNVKAALNKSDLECRKKEIKPLTSLTCLPETQPKTLDCDFPGLEFKATCDPKTGQWCCGPKGQLPACASHETLYCDKSNMWECAPTKPLAPITKPTTKEKYEHGGNPYQLQGLIAPTRAGPLQGPFVKYNVFEKPVKEGYSAVGTKGRPLGKSPDQEHRVLQYKLGPIKLDGLTTPTRAGPLQGPFVKYDPWNQPYTMPPPLNYGFKGGGMG